MKNTRCWLLAFIIIGLAASTWAQKIAVGYDKSVDFSKYKTYTWAKPESPITRPLVYMNVVGQIDDELKAKGLQRIDKDGDFTVIAGGGFGFAYNMPAAPNMNATYWSGEDDRAILMAPLVAEGTLILEFIDRGDNKMVWRGTVKENLDPEMAKSMPQIEKAIIKLLKVYPPKHSK
jgi:hypothetical protein